MKIEFSAIQNLIIDMDGVLWHGDKALPGLIDFFATLRARNIKFVMATNNAGKTGDEYVAKLAKHGVSVTHDEILTTPQASAHYLSIHKPDARIYVVGSPSLASELRATGLIVVSEAEAQTANCVVMGGIVGHLTYEKLAEACLLIRAGALFIGTNPDLTFPGERGVIPGNGALLEALRLATGVAPLIIGKPEPEMQVQAMQRMGGTPANTAVIGDRLDTDILGGQRAGLCTIMVLTGISNRAEAENGSIAPDYIVDDIRAITAKLIAPTC